MIRYSGLSKHDIIFIANEPWEHHVWRRRHHVAWRLAKKNRVLWISSPILSVALLSRRLYGLQHIKRKVIFDLGRLKHQGRNLWAYCPVQLIPTLRKIPSIAQLNKQLVLWDIQRVAKKLGIRSPILWLHKNQCTWCNYEYYGLFNEKLIVYDYFDPMPAVDSGEISDIEWITRAIRKADIVFAVSRKLSADAEKLKHNCYLITHGVDYSLFSSMPKAAPLTMLDSMRKPSLGYLGLMHHKMDFDLLNYVAERRPDWSILLMGSKGMDFIEDRSRFTILIKRENVHYIGEVPMEEVPYYLQHVDVCLIPFKKVESLRYASGPLKLLEYLAAGKPVVAVDQGIEYEYSKFMKVADTKEGFIEAISEALEEERQNGESLAQARKEIARQNCWDERVNQMMAIVETHLDDRN